MAIIFGGIKLVLLFIALAWSANFSVKHIKYLGSIFKIRLFAFGILLGLVTSLPELSLGINATLDKVAELSVGNLIGGIIVMLGLILGASLLLNRKVETDGSLASLLPIVIGIFSIIIFGMDGKYGLFDGLAMIVIYLLLILNLYRLNHFGNHVNIEIVDTNKIGKSIILVIAGIICLLISSHWIVSTTIDLLSYIPVSQLLMGLIIFSIGTNLPEISIAITSWHKKSSELSLSHLLSSSFTNILIIGILAFFRPITFEANAVFWTSAIFLGVILILFTLFYYSGKQLNRQEGAVLLFGYILFIVANFWLHR